MKVGFAFSNATDSTGIDTVARLKVSKRILTLSAVFIAVFLIFVTINTQPMLSPKSVSADPPPGQGPNCPTGTMYNDATERCEAQPTCPSGAPPNSQGQCITTISASNQCPTGYTATGTGQGTCTGDVCPSPPYVAFIGPFLPFPNVARCSAVVGPFVIVTCPTGYTLVGDQCVGSTACPSGSTLNTETSKCDRMITTSSTCPPGTALSGNVCSGSVIPRGPKPT